jgi:hypothetical protein
MIEISVTDSNNGNHTASGTHIQSSRRCAAEHFNYDYSFKCKAIIWYTLHVLIEHYQLTSFSTVHMICIVVVFECGIKILLCP